MRKGDCALFNSTQFAHGAAFCPGARLQQIMARRQIRAPLFVGCQLIDVDLRFETYSTTPRRRVAWKSTDASGRTIPPTLTAHALPDSDRLVCSWRRQKVQCWQSIRKH